jgi:CRP-like cAMP-binding protein
MLAGVPEFRQLTAVRLRELARRAHLQRFAKGAALYENGEPTDGCYVLGSGLVKLSLCGPEGAQKVLRLVSAGEIFGASAVFDPWCQPVTARALAESEAVFLPAQALSDLLGRDPVFARALLKVLSRQIHMLLADIGSYAFASGTQRIAAYLCTLAQMPAETPESVRLPANKTIIASRLGITKETLSRLLHVLTLQGLVEVCGREIRLRDPQHLAELARGSRSASG